ncbi:hypothetical protein [Streptomyces sp. cmx-18-6]|uniref:hypothetical protein n=1 Tax=Streptomyces sp. cmx-18-6 TaxID=2790930 RepID=UPI003980A59A
MTVRSEPAGYWAEVRAEGPVYGTRETVPHVLGTFQTISPKLALRWLQGEAARIADRLDPDPQRSEWVHQSMRAQAVLVPDCPAELRVWADEFDEPAEREYIKAGHPLSEKFPDADCTYSLSVWPVTLPADDHQSIPVPQTQRMAELSYPLYLLADSGVRPF